MKTYMKSVKDLDNRKWYLVDAKDKVLGRLATVVADTLRGKKKVDFTPHMDSGDFVVIINAAKVRLTGLKLNKKIYYSHSRYIGGLKKITAEDLLKKHPTELVKKAVKGMLPKNRLGRQLLTKLKIYPDAIHPHVAQKPAEINV